MQGAVQPVTPPPPHTTKILGLRAGGPPRAVIGNTVTCIGQYNNQFGV